MQKTKIPWCDYTINPVKGLCPMACSYCYARRMYKRFKWNPEIRLDTNGLFSNLPKKPARIFVGSTIELFGPWVKAEWMSYILDNVRDWPQHNFIFLTKWPENLAQWSPFPKNCWVGVSAVNAEMAEEAGFWLYDIKATVKFVSFEPLLGRIPARFADYISDEVQGINWLILGSQTQPTRHPPREWVDEIITAADKAKISAFVKEPMASHYGIQRQEFPGVGGHKAE